MKITKSCSLCKNANLKLLFYGKDKNFHIPGKFPILECRKCRLIFMGIVPDSKELEKYYPKEYYSYTPIDSKGFKFKMKIFLYNLYFNKKKGDYLSKMLFSPFLPFVRGVIISPGKKLLDIGSGSGQFLYEMKQLEMNGQGLEPGSFDEKSARRYELNIKNTDLLGAKYPKEYFDIITMNHVLEHVPNPAKDIEEIYRILNKKGKFIVAVPNYRSLAFFLFGKNWYQLDVPRHLNDFSDKILVKELKGQGFRIERVRYNSRPTQFSISLLYSMNINPKKHPFLTNFLNLFFLPATYFVNSIRLGDQIEVYCSK